MPRKYDVAQPLEPEQAEHVFDMRRQIDRAGKEMRAFALARECRREHRMAARAQQSRRARVAPAAMPRAMHEHEGCGVCHPVAPWRKKKLSTPPPAHLIIPSPGFGLPGAVMAPREGDGKWDRVYPHPNEWAAQRWLTPLSFPGARRASRERRQLSVLRSCA